MARPGHRGAAARSQPTGTATERPHDRPSAEKAEAHGRCIDSRELLGDQPEVGIAHDGTRYRLRVTALGKLILTK